MTTDSLKPKTSRRAKPMEGEHEPEFVDPLTKALHAQLDLLHIVGIVEDGDQVIFELASLLLEWMNPDTTDGQRVAAFCDRVAGAASWVRSDNPKLKKQLKRIAGPNPPRRIRNEPMKFQVIVRTEDEPDDGGPRIYFFDYAKLAEFVQEEYGIGEPELRALVVRVENSQSTR